MRILALDTGTHCGWASWTPDGMASGVQDFVLGRGESTGMRYLRFRKWLREMIVDYVQPEVIAYERSAHFKGVAAAEVAHGFQTIMHEEAAKRGINTAPVQNSKLKKHATGKGNAGKPMMIDAAKKWWKIKGDIRDDEADALCVLAWALEECGTSTKVVVRTRKIQ